MFRRSGIAKLTVGICAWFVLIPCSWAGSFDGGNAYYPFQLEDGHYSSGSLVPLVRWSYSLDRKTVTLAGEVSIPPEVLGTQDADTRCKFSAVRAQRASKERVKDDRTGDYQAFAWVHHLPATVRLNQVDRSTYLFSGVCKAGQGRMPPVEFFGKFISDFTSDDAWAEILEVNFSPRRQRGSEEDHVRPFLGRLGPIFVGTGPAMFSFVPTPSWDYVHTPPRVGTIR